MKDDEKGIFIILIHFFSRKTSITYFLFFTDKIHAVDEDDNLKKQQLKRRKLAFSSSSSSSSRSEDEEKDKCEEKPNERKLRKIVRVSYESHRMRVGPMSQKLKRGLYFTKCACAQILKKNVYREVGCICALIMIGVKETKNLRFFKGSCSGNAGTCWDE